MQRCTLRYNHHEAGSNPAVSQSKSRGCRLIWEGGTLKPYFHVGSNPTIPIDKPAGEQLSNDDEVAELRISITH